MTATRPETAVSFSWIATLKYVGMGLLVAAIGLLMLQADVALVWFLGALFLFGGAAMTVMLPFTGGVHVAPCPLCGATIEVLSKEGRYLACEKCLEYFEASGGRLRQMEETHVAAEPRFEVRLPWWDDLGPPTGSTITIGGPKDYISDRIQEVVLTRRIPDRTVDATWPKACCVCGAPPVRHESLAQQVNVGPGGLAAVRDRKLLVKVEGIPHCSEHEKGVKMSESPGRCGRLLIFRSYAYRNQFRRANPWQINWS